MSAWLHTPNVLVLGSFPNDVVHTVVFGGGLLDEGGGRVVVCVGWVCVLVELCVGVWGGCGLRWSLVTGVMDLGLFSFFRLPLSA